MTMYGLYQPYKVNRPLTKEEKNNQFRQGRYRKVKYFNCARSVIRMNSTYLETMDKFYAKKGQDNAWWLIVFLMTAGIILYVFIRSIIDIPEKRLFSILEDDDWLCVIFWIDNFYRNHGI
ncbi:Uncharacterised protein [Klebsiella michiganensis]|nr:Uncharacterised protein [Klebsiella michiganensis]